MAEKKFVNEREYIIPLRKEWMKVSKYKRTARGIKAIKQFVAKHMRVPDRDLNKVKLDVYLNNEFWARGAKKPPAKIKVVVRRDKDIIKVELANVPESVKFLKARQERIHKKVEKKKTDKKEEKLEDKVDENKGGVDENKDGVDDKVEEKEKEKSVEKAQEKAMEKLAKTQKHSVFKKPDKAPLQRKALKK
ncbi:MAG: 50S ribosomal protein L31e [Candidatus Pacearchaeota archaeon]|nr:50S ribosomal protein L31e [Candidatus Pacearchaeota archaeon]